MDDIIKQTQTNKDISDLVDQIREFNEHIITMNQIVVSLGDRLRSLEKSLVYATTSLQSSIYQEQKDHLDKPQLFHDRISMNANNESHIVL